MKTNFTADTGKKGKVVLALIITLTFVTTILFWAVIKVFQLSGFPLYFSQLGLYLIFFLLAWWGIKKEQISLAVNKRQIVEALALSFISWVVFLTLIQVFGLAKLSQEFQSLIKIPFWKIGLQILSVWLFVGLGEEMLFRGYYYKAFWQHYTKGIGRQRIIKAILLASAFFSLWHLPVRIVEVISGDLDWVTLIISLLVLFLLGIGFTYLYIRSGNIILVGLVHGLMDYPLIGKNTQVTFFILLVAIGCVEIARLTASRKFEINSSTSGQEDLEK